ncbi:transcription factor bHLH162 [Cornus florida]|uniref:transcription factor bHLH162 n=1 Tax=Cornus florida TaxID=4283 RepID=UPI0028A01873|nr:transcription factor bHLH162 [Cornus florida]
MEINNPSSSRTDRKTIEKNRRNHMKTLYSKLNSLVPHQSSREVVSLPDQLDEAANYIKKLQMNLEKMKEKKNRLMRLEKMSASTSTGVMVGLRSPQIEIHEMGSALEVVLITGLDCQFMFNEIIRVLHEERAEVVNAGFSVVDDAVFHSIHSKVAESASGYGAPKISERLKQFVYGANSC